MAILIRNIEFGLTEKSIKKAISEIELIRDSLAPAMGRLIDELTKQGAQIAKAQLVMFDKPAYDTGQLQESIEAIPFDGKAGYVRTDVPYAIYVEYGTGPEGNIAPHPLGGKYRLTGWRYYNERIGKILFTYGMGSRPFMYNTYRLLQDEAKYTGGRIVAEYIAEYAG